MKICIVCGRLCYGGAERVAVMWANGFLHRGHEVMVVTNLNDPITYHLDEGIEVRQLTGPNDNKLKKWANSVPNLRRYIKEFCPNVVIGVMATCSLVARMATIGLDIPVVATEHDSFEKPPSAPMGRWTWFAKFILNRIYTHVTVLTEADRKVIGNKLSHVTVMPNPLAFEPVERVEERERVILAMGRLDAGHSKGFDVLIKAFGMTSSGWSLQIAGVGKPENVEKYKKLAEECGVADRVSFTGYTEDPLALFRKSEIFVLSSRYEGFGLVLIEAMSQGCAPVACDYKGRQREIIYPSSVHPQREGEQLDATSKYCACDNGILCEPDNAEQLAAAIARMISDDKYRMSVQQNAISRSRYYSIENTVDRWEQLLNKVI